MLVLGRNVGEYVVVGENIFVRVVKQNGDLKLAIDAPKMTKLFSLFIILSFVLPVSGQEKLDSDKARKEKAYHLMI